MLVLSTWSGYARYARVVACYSKLGGRFLGKIVWPIGGPHEVVTRLQQEGAKLLPGECCYSFMGVFVNQQELTSPDFINTGQDDYLPDRVEQAEHTGPVRRVDFMWLDQRCRDSRLRVRYSFDANTKVLRLHPSVRYDGGYEGRQLEAFTKFDFKTPTLGVSTTSANHSLISFDFLQVLHVDSALDGIFVFLPCVPNLRVLMGQVYRWNKDFVDALAKLTRLESLSASNHVNSRVQLLVGNISKLKNLKHLELEGCSVSHSYKSDFGEIRLLDKLVDLRLRTNLFEGFDAMPSDFAMLHHLETLHLLGGEKTVQIPHDLLKNLKHLHCSCLSHLKRNPGTFMQLYLRVL